MGRVGAYGRKMPRLGVRDFSAVACANVANRARKAVSERQPHR